MIMKRIIFALTTALMLCTLAQGKNRTVTENDSLGNKQRVIELKDTVIDGKAVTDTLSIMTYENSSNSNSESDNDYKHHSSAYDFGWNIGHATRDAVIAITAIVFVFGWLMLVPPGGIWLSFNHRIHYLFLPLQKPEGQIPPGGTSISQRTTAAGKSV